jgi:hypothetical protein
VAPLTVVRIRAKIGEQRFLDGPQAELRCSAYRPSPSQRVLIPKAGRPGQFRPLGIPTDKDRVVQGAVKIVLELIFEAQFWHVSYGFRPGRRMHGALEHLRRPSRGRRLDHSTQNGSGSLRLRASHRKVLLRRPIVRCHLSAAETTLLPVPDGSGYELRR